MSLLNSENDVTSMFLVPKPKSLHERSGKSRCVLTMSFDFEADLDEDLGLPASEEASGT
jgi:hypothetical protein